jgi:hypothetical protein
MKPLTHPMPASAAIDQHQSAKASPIRNGALMPRLLEIFRERCEARCLLVSNGLMDLQTAVDQLQEVAVAQGLVKQYGQDEIQQVMAESFGRWRV